jgi:hypothetical protein
VAYRTGLAIWRGRLAWTAGLFALAGVLGATWWNGTNNVQVAGAATDCADKAMFALVARTEQAARLAYPCLGVEARQGMGEDAFVQGMQVSARPAANRLIRVADHPSASGGSIVYYAVEGSAQSIGYMVYVAGDGRVEKIE